MSDAPPFRQTDVLDPARAMAMQATLGLSQQLAAGDLLPPFYHQLYFWTPEPPEALGGDGHPRVGGIIPDMGLPRRMWAGGQLQFHAPLRLARPAEKTTTLHSHMRKEGRSGPLGFVTLRHEVRQDGVLCVTEMQDLVYREAARVDAPKPKPPIARGNAETRDALHFTSTQLFRYSALTFNGHRIHYDLDYARDVEGYEGLVVHGPLLAQLIMLKAQDELGPLRSFTFRATAPLMHFETAELCRNRTELWVTGPDGRQCMQASAEPIGRRDGKAI